MDISCGDAGAKYSRSGRFQRGRTCSCLFLTVRENFSKKFKPGVTKQGGNLDNQWCGEVFFEFFPKVATQLGDVLEITPVEDESFLKKSFERV